MRQYQYVGPSAIRDRHATGKPAGTPIDSSGDVLAWLRETGQRVATSEEVIVTFVVDVAGGLLIAERHSEHVACAGGEPVLSAGEITFVIEKGSVRVTAISNQSTGYCPEPESWLAVETALTRAGLAAPRGFTLTCLFRMCAACGEKCIVKDSVFECLVCGKDLPTDYNCQP